MNTNHLKNKKILLAEDDFFNQELMKDIFESMECQVDIAETGKQALEKFVNQSYDIILMDIQMPEKDGYQTAREIRQWERQKNLKPIPILALTANALSGDRAKCLEAGMNDYISKPINLAELREKITSYLPGLG